MIKLISASVFILFLITSCTTPTCKQNGVNNTNVAAPYSISNLIIDTITIQKFIGTHAISDTIQTQVIEFYKRRNYTFAWLNDNGAKQAVLVFYSQLKNYSYCFADSSLNTKTLDVLIADLNKDKKTFFSQNNNSEQLELQLTTTFFKFAKIAYSGTAIDLKNLEWFIPRDIKNYQSLLDSLIIATKNTKVYEPVNEHYFRLKNKLVQYRSIEKKGGFPIIAAYTKTLALGSIDASITSVKHQLFLTSDLHLNDTTTLFTDSLLKAVKRFQHRMGLTENGKLDLATSIELGKPIGVRIKQIMINMERLRWIPVTIEKNYLLVNIPEFKLHVFKNNKPVWATNIVVGKSATQTSIFKSNVTQIILNPYWGVPQSIANKEVLMHLKKNTDYLNHNNMEVLLNDKVINPDGINWNEYITHVPFTFRQKPGKNNALGKIKYSFPNSFDIYLHDTPSKNLFNDTRRAFSHGCIRVANPQKLATYLLVNNPDWNTKRINKILKTDDETFIKLTTPIPIYIVYITSWVDNTGQLNFRNDVYNLDKKLAADIFGEQYK
ncbi:MAG: L,D-transpeptidase family protein [Bacteroidia bacterium]|nr:L,D-transpeptidase family protein [Bacteroidia bacterium]